MSGDRNAERLAPGLPCVHCGLCLDTCPTYRVLGNEADSPRGRIYLMESVRSGELKLDRQAAGHLDACLGCLACETACPSGVSYGARIEEFRPKLASARALPFRRRVWRRIVGATAASPRFMSAAMTAAARLDALGLTGLRRRIPGLGVLPARPADASHEIAPGERSRVPQPQAPVARAALLTGCVADVVRPDITRAAVEVLRHNRIATIAVPEQVCCGALAMHTGDAATARALAETNVRAFGAVDADFVVSTAAGCGLMLREYGQLLADDAAAGALSGKVRDVSEVLVEIGLVAPERTLETGRVVYHDACHLLHGAGVADAPRHVLEAALGRPAADLGENHLCCGSAGTYNVEHPAMAEILGNRKAELASAAGADVVAVGNVGCMLQIKSALERAGSPARTVHPVELLAEAYAAESV